MTDPIQFDIANLAHDLNKLTNDINSIASKIDSACIDPDVKIANGDTIRAFGAPLLKALFVITMELDKK